MTIPGKYQNRLIHEKSPYLLQHADNPVDWHPWGEEAFEKAKAQDKPVFLSIGYSTCHWCHVMEHESFEDEHIAAMINDYFIPVKVDREERPDIDSIYMSAVMTMTGSGGWPLTVLLTPDQKPFYGGTYFPPQAKWGTAGLTDILESVHDAWTNRRDDLLRSGESLTLMLAQRGENPGGPSSLDEGIFTRAFEQYEHAYDPVHGGFGDAPKFPTGHNLSFLLRYWKRTGSAKALEMVTHTLRSMAQGGMYDHIGGGFHRYSTDRQWQIPHFEKMLYDQAILVRVYLEAYQITHEEYFAGIAREIFNFVLREMRDPRGGFYSAQDADSLEFDAAISPGQGLSAVKKEGAYYIWRKTDIEKVLDKTDAEIFNYHYGVEADGNAHSDPHQEFTGKNIIYVSNSIEETAAKYKRSVPEIQSSLDRSREILRAVRERRPRPNLDDKILMDWNALMIGSLAYGGRVLREPEYLTAAEKAADFALEEMTGPGGRLWHRYRDGDAAILGTLEDYAFFINGLLDLYEATFNVKYLKQSVALSESLTGLFGDENDGGFYLTGRDAESLLFRPKEVYDGAIPSGNSMAALALVRVAHMTLDPKWEDQAESVFKAFVGTVTGHPSGYAQMLMAYDFYQGPSKEIVIAVESEETDTAKFTIALDERFLPYKVVMLRPGSGPAAEQIVAVAPFVEYQLPLNGQTTIYVCENHMCKNPVQDIDAFIDKLDH